MIISVTIPMQRPVSPNMINPGNFHLPVRAHDVDCSMCLNNFAPNSQKSGDLCQDWYRILFSGCLRSFLIWCERYCFVSRDDSSERIGTASLLTLEEA